MSEQIIRKAGEPEVIKKAGDGASYTFVISSEEPDLVNDVVVQAGLKPVSERIPAQIDHSGSVKDLIGHWQNIRRQGKQTLADFIPFQKGISQAADLVTALLDSGVRMASSIGFRGIDVEMRDPKKGYSGGMLYKESNLLETSIVVVPCHPSALSIAKSMDMPVSVINMVFDFEDEGEEIDRQMRFDDVLARAKRLVKPHIVI